MKLWQTMIRDWMFNEVGDHTQWDPTNRGQRLLEETLELVQCQPGALTKEQAHSLVDYVYSRPVGHFPQEIGGTIVCLLAICDATGENLHQCLIDEYNRITTPGIVEKVRNAIVRKRNDGVGI